MAQGRNGVPDVPGAVSWLPEAARSHDIQRLLQPLVPASWQKLCFASTKSRNAEEFGTKPFFEGEVAPCINGGALAIGAYFRHPTESLARRLVCEQLDGGWNCETPKSTRSSFHTTICVLEGLLEYERAVGSAPEITAARGRGEEYLLKRALLRRLSTGEVANPAFLKFAYPPRYHYDVLRALDYFRLAGVPPDVRFDDAFQVIDSRCQADGRWLLDEAHDEALALPFSESMGQPSRWNTLRALRVLRWSGRRMS